MVVYDKRKHLRREISRPVKAVTIDDSRIATECRLIDVSQSGARLKVAASEELPSEFLLVLSEEVQRWCRVVRRVKSDVGVKFIRTRRSPGAAAGTGPATPENCRKNTITAV
jgi:hypothetical protein